MAFDLDSALGEFTAFFAGRGGSDRPILFDEVPLLEGVGGLYAAPSRLPPFKRLLLARYPLVD